MSLIIGDPLSDINLRYLIQSLQAQKLHSSRGRD